MDSFPTRSPAKIQAAPGKIWQKARIGFLPQQSMTAIAKRYPGISTKTLRQKLAYGSPPRVVEPKESP